MAEVVFRLSHHLPLQTFTQSMSHAVNALYTPLYAIFAQQAVGNRLQHPAQMCSTHATVISPRLLMVSGDEDLL